jgi:hypothetical protein
MAFFRPADSQKHSLAECEAAKCQECEIPVVFRIKKYPTFLLPPIYSSSFLERRRESGG